MNALGGFGVILSLFLIVVALLWIFVPFILMGTNRRLDKLLEEARETNCLLAATRARPDAAAPANVIRPGDLGGN